MISAAAQAQAPEEQAASSVSNEDIVVTARRKDESLQDVPQVVNAVTGAAIEKLNIQKFEDIQTVVPGLSLASGSSGTSTRLSLRGVTYDSFGSAPPTVEFYMNDATIFGTLLFQSMYDIGQIEVLRGPQGTLRGRAAPSGSITVTTRRADLFDVGGYVNGTATDRGGINLNAAIGVPIIKGAVALRLAGIVDQNDYDFVKSVNNGTSPFSNSRGGRASLRIEPSDNITANITYQYLDRQQKAFPGVESMVISQPGAAVGTGPFLRAADRRGITDGAVTIDEQQQVLNGQLTWRFAGQRLDYVGSLTFWDSKTSTPQDLANLIPGTELRQNVETDFQTRSNEVRLSSDERLFNFLDYTIGVFDFWNRSTNDIDNVGTLIDTYQRRHERSFFGNLTAHLGENTEISGGIRKITFKSADRMTLTAFGIDLLPYVERKHTPTIYNASISHRFSDDFMVYASTGSSWRAGPLTLGVFRPLTPNLDRFLNIRPEKSKSYEVGFKSTLLDRRLTLNVSAFHQDFDGYIYRGAPVNYVNLGRTGESLNVFNFQANVPAKVNGVEVELAYKPSDRFNLSASFAYAKGKIKNGEIACNDSDGDGVPDTGPVTIGSIKAASGGDAVAACSVTQRLSYAPNWSLVLTPEYNAPITERVSGFVRGLFSYYPDNPNDPTNAFDSVKAYSLLNLYLGIRDPDNAWEVSLFAKNLLNTKRTLTRGDRPQATFGVTNPAYGDYVSATYTRPREFGVNVRYAFGSR
ncbi:TonB-dependent receptor [Sphingobium tyrosinilyticum]|uniref:TonB-dependent receptor n=2 Tax=Sphingobium tyrosinilyticum TaxID=2715436 RepID=A0ABV9F3L0_9SPHN